MKDFPSEYTYIDEHGQVWYKTYQMKKVEVEDLNPYILSGLPVVINPETTVETLFDTINKYALLKVNCIAFDSFYKELKSKSEEPEEGYLVFSWDGISLDNSFQNTLYPMNSVYMEKDNTKYSIDLANTSELRNLKIKINLDFNIYDNHGNIHKTASVRPTLYQIIYGLFWELSFHGTPENRDSIKEDLKKTIEELKQEDLVTYTSVDNLFEDLKKK